MFPMGCMRVFMTTSCSSVVIRFRRWEAARKVVSFVRLAKSRTWLRANTSSPTRFITLSSNPTSTRIVLSEAVAAAREDCWMRSASTTSAGRAAPCSTRISPMRRGSPSFCFSTASRIAASVTPALCIRMSPIEDGNAAASEVCSGTGATALFVSASGDCCRRVSVAISFVSSRSPSPPLASILPSIWRTASTMPSSAVVSSGLSVSCPSRSRVSRFSPTCATFSSWGKPRNPQVPLMV